jgi:hypothetical protein
MDITDENLEKIADVSETIDNLFHAMQIPVEPELLEEVKK